MRRLTFSISILLAVIVHGQDCTAKQFFESGPPACNDLLESVQCVDLDITDSYDFDGKEMIFIWDMGDGNEVEGLEVHYCYEQGGSYQASLTLIDPVTKIEINDELIVDIFLKGEASLKLDSITTVELGQSLTPSFEMILPTGFQAVNYYWSFGNGEFSCETSPSIAYSANGKNQLLLNVEVSNGEETLYLCDETIVEAGSADPSNGQIDAAFEKLIVEARFLEAKVNYQLLSKEEGGYSPVTYSDAKAGGTYLLVAYRGNNYLVSDEINAADNANLDDIRQLIDSEAQRMATKEPETLESLVFDLDETDLSKKHQKELKRNAAQLNKYPFFKIMIGSYTHTGGSYDRNRKLSVDRSELLETFFKDNGVEAGRLAVADPQNQRALINTCLTGGNCDYEDEALDRRADFKIVGFSIQ